MTKIEQQKPEIDHPNIIEVDPTIPFLNSPAAMVVNMERYQMMNGKNFRPGLFQPTLLAWVEVATSDGQTENRLMIVDGMTRIKYAVDHQSKDPQFASITAIDVTQDLLHNTEIASIAPHEPRQRDTLTMPQYLRAIIPTTFEHQNVIAYRLVIHFNEGWRYLVGADIADRFTPVAAFYYLDKYAPHFPQSLPSFLQGQETIMGGETSDQHSRLVEGLKEIIYLIERAKIKPHDLAIAAFEMATQSNHPVMGTDLEIRKQITGLLHTAEADNKLLQARFYQEADREIARARLGELMVQALQKYQQIRGESHGYLNLVDNIFHNNTTLTEMETILTSADPEETYTEMKLAKRVQMITNALTELYANEINALTEFDQQTIQKMAGFIFTDLDMRQATKYADLVKTAREIYEDSMTIYEYLQQNSESLVKKGVNRDFLQKSQQRLQAAIGKFSNLEMNPISLPRYYYQLDETRWSVRSEIIRQIGVERLKQKIRDIWQGNESALLLESAIILYINNQPKIDWEEGWDYIDEILSKLFKLDIKYLSEVVNNKTRIDVALARQKAVKASRQKTEAAEPSITTSQSAVQPIRTTPPRSYQTFAAGTEPQPVDEGITPELFKSRTAMFKTFLSLLNRELTKSEEAVLKEIMDKLGERIYGIKYVTTMIDKLLSKKKADS